MHAPLLLSTLLAFSAAPAAADDIPLQQTLDIPYSDDSPLQALDVFAPKNAANRPVVLFVHGGAWMIGDKDTLGLYRGVGLWFAKQGAVAVCINYRLAPAAKHPDQVKDVARAFAWTRAHVRDYGGDPDRIFLCGHSAGGHLVSLLATDEAYLKDPALKLTDADRAALKGVMSVSGIYCIPTQEQFNAMLDGMVKGLIQISDHSPIIVALAPALKRLNCNLNPFRLTFGDDNAAAQQAAPLTHVRKGLPPFLVLYAERELPMVDDMAREFAKALKDKGDPVEIEKIPHCDHNFILFKLDQPHDPAAAALLAFLDKYGGPRTDTKP
ncbi:MAG TPA: alpha/beta hydrolase [Gemmataceae bacterium]|nr:alpha/beta hydrolase [Gemmataceae bacterium]